MSEKIYFEGVDVLAGEAEVCQLSSDDGRFDSGFVVRSKLHAPTFTPAGLDDQLTTHVATSPDYAYAYALGTTEATRSGDSRLEARVTVGF
jgi:hypothetical protein